MKANRKVATVTTAAATLPAPSNIVALPSIRLGRIPKAENAIAHRQRFRILPFTNATGSKSYRVQGMGRDGRYVRQNFASLHDAQLRQIELEADFHARQPDASGIRATKLSETQLRIAEAAFLRLDADEHLLTAVNFWMEHGRPQARVESPSLDDAVSQFAAWLETTPELRERTKANLKLRVAMFGNSLRNMRVGTITPEIIEGYLDKRKASPATKDNDRRALSRFFRFCVERPRRWLATNPCREVRVARGGDDAPPTVLTVAECETLLRAAEAHKGGLLAPYVAACLFAGLRPFEASRMTWKQVNFADGEIRLEASQTKTKRARVITIGPTLKAWLEAYQGQPFYPVNWRKHFDAVKEAAGFTSRDTKDAKPWAPDVMRHTAASHYFRDCLSYGRTAEAFGNSEAIIKAHYQGRVSSEDTKAFYGLLPTQKGSK